MSKEFTKEHQATIALCKQAKHNEKTCVNRSQAAPGNQFTVDNS